MALLSHVVERVVEAFVLALAALATSEFNLLTGGGAGEAAFLTSELVSMRAFLDSASAAAGDVLLRVSAEEIRKLSSEIERGVHAYNAASRDRGGSHNNTGLGALVKRCARLPSAVWSRRRAAEEMLGLKERVLEAAERRKRYRLLVDVGGCAAGAGGRPRGAVCFQYSCHQEKKIQGDAPVPQSAAPEDEEEETMAARLERVERELQRERDERRQDREHWVILWQSMAERLPPPPPQQADAFLRAS